MKVDRHGRAKILTQSEIELLFREGFTVNPPRDRALFAVMLYTACRVREAVQLLVRDVYDSQRKIRPVIIFRKKNTKGKLATRTIPVIQELRYWLSQYPMPHYQSYLFPGQQQQGRKYLHQDSASWLLREACKRVGIEGVSTHSFRRTALTQMSNAGIPLRIIQEISGHRTLDELYKYLEVQESQVIGAVNSLSMLSAKGSSRDNFDISSFNEPSNNSCAPKKPIKED
jgi:integrase/recombinase XerD